VTMQDNPEFPNVLRRFSFPGNVMPAQGQNRLLPLANNCGNTEDYLRSLRGLGTMKSGNYMGGRLGTILNGLGAQATPDMAHIQQAISARRAIDAGYPVLLGRGMRGLGSTATDICRGLTVTGQTAGAAGGLINNILGAGSQNQGKYGKTTSDPGFDWSSLTSLLGQASSALQSAYCPPNTPGAPSAGQYPGQGQTAADIVDNARNRTQNQMSGDAYARELAAQQAQSNADLKKYLLSGGGGLAALVLLSLALK